MTLPLFEPSTVTDMYTAVVIHPNGSDSLRKFIPNIYEAKLWITEKIFLNKENNGESKFPFGFDYCIITSDAILLTPEDLNLPERIQ